MTTSDAQDADIDTPAASESRSPWGGARNLGRAVAARSPTLDTNLFIVAIAVFLATRMIGLVDYPIYFFADEAIQTLHAAELVDDGWRSEGRLLPTYFRNGTYYNLSASVYAQVIPYMLFGFSVFATRATSALIALTGTAAAALILRDIFKLRFWWAGALLLSMTPAWFLHSRTAFETVLAVSFFAWALYFYLRYRYDCPVMLLPSVLFLAMAFYAYAGSQLAVALIALAIVATDVPYHWRHRRIVLAAVAVGAVLALPYLRFRMDQGEAVGSQLRTLDSYWVDDDLTLLEKFRELATQYGHGIDPRYWYRPDTSLDLQRHEMKGFGHILWPTLPFALVGLAVCARNIKAPAHRALLILLIGAPLGGAIVAVSITRVMLFVLPAALLTTIGVATVLAPLTKRVRYDTLAVGLCALLVTTNLFVLRAALVDGPTWYRDYGLYGLQYGGVQIADAVEEELEESPDAQIFISPNWANTPNYIFDFLLHDQPRASIDTLSRFRVEDGALTDDMLFVLPSDEYAALNADKVFDNVRVERTISYPDDTIGFYIVRVGYAESANTVLQEERAERSKPETATATIGEDEVTITHSQFDIGRVSDLFDDDGFTLVRTLEANPAILDIEFPFPRKIAGLTLAMGTHDIEFTAELYAGADTAASTFTETYSGLGQDPTIDVLFDNAPPNVTRLRLVIRDLNATAIHIHIRELTLR